jgi:hypothetical protein
VSQQYAEAWLTRGLPYLYCQSFNDATLVVIYMVPLTWFLPTTGLVRIFRAEGGKVEDNLVRGDVL